MTFYVLNAVFALYFPITAKIKLYCIFIYLKIIHFCPITNNNTEFGFAKKI